jgi:hypothetical protein
VAAVSVCEAQAPPLDVVLDRLGEYLLDYETKVFELAADEQFDQWIKRRPGWGGATVSRRKIASTFFLVRLPDGQAWYGFRDVSRVDGKPVASRDRSMAEILGERTVDAYDEAMAVMRENAKYNIGAVYRTLNLPLQALELLHPQNRGRFEFTPGGQARIGRRLTVLVDFAERVRPTLVSDGFGGDVPARGRVWVDAATGAVHRTDLRFGGADEPVKDARIEVDYARDSRMQALLPTRMEETYGLDIEVVHGRATYRNYRRFQTSARLVTPPRQP